MHEHHHHHTAKHSHDESATREHQIELAVAALRPIFADTTLEHVRSILEAALERLGDTDGRHASWVLGLWVRGERQQ